MAITIVPKCTNPDCFNDEDPSNGKGLCPGCDKIDCDDGMEQAREMCENMHEFGTIDKPNANTEGWCNTHKMWEAEGGPCAECERLAQLEIAKMDRAMQEQQYSLWVVCQKTHLFKVPVYNFNDAKTLYHSLNWNVVSGVRIARHCEVEGCEVVLHKFR